MPWPRASPERTVLAAKPLSLPLRGAVPSRPPQHQGHPQSWGRPGVGDPHTPKRQAGGSREAAQPLPLVPPMGVDWRSPPPAPPLPRHTRVPDLRASFICEGANPMQHGGCGLIRPDQPLIWVSRSTGPRRAPIRPSPDPEATFPAADDWTPSPG